MKPRILNGLVTAETSAIADNINKHIVEIKFSILTMLSLLTSPISIIYTIQYNKIYIILYDDQGWYNNNRIRKDMKKV